MAHVPDIEQLLDDGYAALMEGRPREALRIARRIKPMRHSSWFEIGARALWDLDRRRWALNLLEKGVATVPQCHPLWHWLACYRSDSGDYEGALAAFDREAAFEEAVPEAVAYNRAVVYERLGRPEDALEALADIRSGPDETGPSAASFAELRARLHAELEDFEAALTHADAALALQDPEEPDDALEGRSLAIRSWAHLRLGDAFQAREDLDHAIRLSYGRLPGYVLKIARTLDIRPSRQARHFELYCCGPLDDERNFVVRADVLADDDEEALGFVLPFLPPEARDRTRTGEAIDHGPAGSEGWSYVEQSGEWLPLKGLYQLGRLHAYPREAS